MANTVQIDIVSAEESIFSGMAEFIAAPAIMGEVGIYPHHAPMITALKSGSVRIKLADKSEEQLVFVSGGILEVQPGHVTVLSDTAIRGADLDEAKALAAKKSAEDAIKNKSAEIDFAKAQAELAQAMAQLQAIEKLRKKK
ncbi:MAG: F0F1 ATP synthase subunit epsilon [Proteobacteria bacterium]|jgi:F-type H+-transporting ATPase subunit epsilon|nr:F0F1 ATP synthase subunit epsilon [Pseudomonadota bacterium]MDA0872411.1 F0F1 ATP synthase subunit epsilon [Pseudomonadota bacterium]MDA1134315.1 F0F1 ATP synthase subunit epsilon [Pseudomonadota bacterium]